MEGKADWPCQLAGEGSFAGKSSNFGLQVFCRIRILSPSLPWKKLMLLRSDTAAVTFNSCSIIALHMTISVRNTELAFEGEFCHRKSSSIMRGFHTLSFLQTENYLEVLSQGSLTHLNNTDFPTAPQASRISSSCVCLWHIVIPPGKGKKFQCLHWFLIQLNDFFLLTTKKSK